MAKLNEQVKSVFEQQRIVILGTASRDGIPNSVPIGAKKIIDDETILISDQYFGKTLQNMKENPHAALTFWNPKTGEGYQVKGIVTIETSGKRFEETAAWVEAMGKGMGVPLKSKGAVVMKITDVYCVTPGDHAGEKIA